MDFCLLPKLEMGAELLHRADVKKASTGFKPVGSGGLVDQLAIKKMYRR